MNENKSKYDLDVLQILEMLLKRWWILLLALVICVGAAFGYTKFFVKPTYTSTTSVHVRGGGNLNIYQAILAGQYQSGDYKEILKSYDTLREAAENLNAQLEAEGGEAKFSEAMLRSMVSYSVIEDSNIFVISVKGADPQETKLVADEVSEIFKRRVFIITKADVSSEDVESARIGELNPSGMSRNIIIGAALGLIIGAGIAILLGITNDVIYSDDWILSKYKDEVPLLSSIPDVNGSKGKGYYKYKYYDYSSEDSKAKSAKADGKSTKKIGKDLDFASSEAYKLLRTNIMFSVPDRQTGKVIGVTSPCPQEGKSTTSINLAYSLAESGNKVLLVDSDMRRPSISKMLEMSRTPGLSNRLAGGDKDAVNIGILHENLSIMFSGDIPPNPSELISSPNMAALIEEFRGAYDYVIVDLPPVTAVSDPLIMSKNIDGLAIVIRHGHTRTRDVAETMRQLRLVNAKTLGFIYNGAQRTSKSFYRNA